MTNFFKQLAYIMSRVLNLIYLHRIATYESSKVRFAILRLLVRVSAFKVLHKNINLPDDETRTDFYYSNLYNIQNLPKSFFAQIIMGFSLINLALFLNKTFCCKHDGKTDAFGKRKTKSSKVKI